ncbi:MAG TPA: histidine kinase [Solirubrobacteraceae bacterium]|nr:histidine kinase [Solirubrobacteraceae bacterium]
MDATSATAGRAILVAGVTVTIGLAGLLFTGFGVFTSMALGAILVVAIAVVGSLTVLPAVLALLGERGLKSSRTANRERTPSWDHPAHAAAFGAGHSEDGGGTPFVEPAELYPLTAVVAVVVVIWALTGAGYFWPIWPVIGLGFSLAATSAFRWSARRRHGRDRVLAGAGAVGIVICTMLVVIWLITGAGYFWPVWGMFGFALPAGLIWLVRRPVQRSLEVRVDELTRSRSGVLDVQASELRRIERDLHDGAQARLVALTMKLGRAEERVADNPETAALLRQAREDATAAIAELRDLARGIAPPVLADRGLEAAVRSLAERIGAEVAVDSAIVRRPPPVVETAAYFVVAEALTNAAKHAAGSEVRVTLTATAGELVVEVIDDGPGGAVPAGRGLTGLRQRVEALDGRLEVISPPGVGTMIEAVLPCGW